MFLRHLFVLTVSILIAGFSTGGPPEVEDSKKLEGIWKLIPAEGPDKVPAYGKGFRLKITRKFFYLLQDGNEFNGGNWQIDSVKKPREIDMTLTVRARDPDGLFVKIQEVRRGIYKFEDDKLTICIAFAEDKKTPNPSLRPTEFKATGDLTILVLQRDK